MHWRSIWALFGSTVDEFVPRNLHINLRIVRQSDGGTAFIEFGLLGAARDPLQGNFADKKQRLPRILQ